MKTKFVTIDGRDNVGKTTLIDCFISTHTDKNIKRYSESKYYKGSNFFAMSVAKQVHTIYSVRQDLKEELQSDISSGEFDYIVADRYNLSTLAYQHSENKIIGQYITSTIYPDFQFILNPVDSFTNVGDEFDCNVEFQDVLYERFNYLYTSRMDVCMLTQPSTYLSGMNLVLGI